MTLEFTENSAYEHVRLVTAEALLQEIRSDVPVTVLDVRTREAIHASGAIHGERVFPFGQLSGRLTELMSCQSMPIVVISQSGRRAVAAAQQLQATGFTEVFVLENGLQRWMDLGYPLEARRDSTQSPLSVR